MPSMLTCLVARKDVRPSAFNTSLTIDMKFSRLFQPRNPLFWLMLAVNALSLILAVVAQTRTLNSLGNILVYGFAIGNALLGILLAWRLASDDQKKE